jgi:hypothetical protein
LEIAWSHRQPECLGQVSVDPQAERDAFCRDYGLAADTAACTAGDVLTDKLQAAYHRRAVRHALVEYDYLSITRRSIPQPIHTAKCARIM